MASQLARLTIAPKSVTLQPGELRRFSVSANWQTGATDLPPHDWRASGGSISSVGEFVAPQAAGTYLVIVQHRGGQLSDTAVVSVPGVVPSPTDASFAENLPPGMTLITDTRFGNMRAKGVMNEDGLSHHYDARNASDPNAPFGPGIFEVFYPGNHAGNGETGGWLTGRPGNRWKRVYFSILVWVPEHYSTHSNGEKFFYPIIATPGQPNQSSYVEWRPIGTDTPNGPTFGLHLLNQTTNTPTRRLGQSTSAPRVTKGRWTKIEVYFQMNGVGQQNGVWKAWVDGKPTASFANVVFSSATAQSFFDGIRFTGTRGGGASTALTPPGGQVRRYTRLAFYAAQE
jgi:hypothetical protein